MVCNKKQRGVYGRLFRPVYALVLLLLAAPWVSHELECRKHDRPGFAGEYALPPINHFVEPPPAPAPGEVLHTSAELPLLHSRPGALRKLHIDFDGNTSTSPWWNGGNAVTTPPYSRDSSPLFSDSEITSITEIWQRVSEDYSPFDIDVTTEDPGNFDSRSAVKICVGGAYSDWYGHSAGGVAYVSAFYYGNLPAFVFEDNLDNGNPKYTAEAVSHEAGHTFGLQHQSLYSGTTKTQEYHPGSGSGVLGWAPIMGVSYYKNLSTWHNGPTPAGSTALQDDLNILSGAFNMFGYRADDHGDSNAAAAELTVTGGTNVSGAGVIEQMSDVDVFSFNAGAGSLNIRIDPSSLGPDLVVWAELYDSVGTLIAASHSTTQLYASFSRTLTAGTYYLHVLSNGDYGRIGQYSISGTIPAAAPANPLPTGSLSASAVSASGGTSYTFSVTYSDETAVETGSLDSTDISVRGPNGFSQAAQFVSVDNETDGSPRQATYSITPPGGSWNTADNGTYTIALNPLQVTDTLGASASAADLGTFSVSIADTTAPSVPELPALSSVTTVGGTSYVFTVTFTDDVAVKTSSLGTGDISISGPSAFSAAATFQSVNSSANGTPRTASYAFTPPGGSWDSGDNGTYTIVLNDASVSDTADNLMPSQTLGSFSVSIVNYSITGTITSAGGAPLAGVTVQGGALGNQTTNGSGSFSFNAIPAGTSFSLTPVKTGYHFTPSGRSGTLLNNSTADFSAAINTYQYLGSVRFGSKPVSGFRVAFNGQNLFTDIQGHYMSALIAHGTSVSVTPNESCYLTSPAGYSLTAGTGSTQTDFTVTGCAAGCLMRIDAATAETRCYADRDHDQLTDIEEGQRGSDPDDADSDNDGIYDGQEVADGTSPTDRGSGRLYLGGQTCAEWNGNLQPMDNVMEHMNLGSGTVSAESTLYRLDGSVGEIVYFNIAGLGKFDLLAHALNGFTPGLYGKVCTRFEGSLDGGMVYYKRPAAGGEYSFAFMMPFAAGISGRQFVPFNTFQPSQNWAEQSYLVANWVQLTSLNALSEAGSLNFYDMTGTKLCERRLTLSTGQRVDTPAHGALPGEQGSCTVLGPWIVGLVEWVPDNPAAKFQLRNVRYLYDNPGNADSFKTAFQLLGGSGSGETLAAVLDTRNATAVLELVNTRPEEIAVDVTLYTESGFPVFHTSIPLAGHSSYHLITNDYLVSTLGLGVVRGTLPESLMAVAMEYGRDPALGVRWMYGLQAVEAAGTAYAGGYNTFLDQGCKLLLGNSQPSAATATLSMTRSTGSVLVSGVQMIVPAHGVVEYDCRRDTADRYGSIAVSASSPLVGSVLRVGSADRYRFTTPLR